MSTWADPTGHEQQTLTHASSTPRSSLVKPQGNCTQDEVGTTRCRQPLHPHPVLPNLGELRQQRWGSAAVLAPRGVTHQSP